jgi:phosphoribosylpyrophosphate synthetase
VDRIIISDTIPPFRLDARLVAEKVTILSASQAIADGIRNIAAI